MNEPDHKNFRQEIEDLRDSIRLNLSWVERFLELPRFKPGSTVKSLQEVNNLWLTHRYLEDSEHRLSKVIESLFG